MMWENPNSTHRGVRPAVTDDGRAGWQATYAIIDP